MHTYVTNSEKETRDLAAKLAEKLKGVIALTGKLGAGKTTFVQGFAKGLGIKEKIISPTFILIRRHKIPNSPRTLFHLDLYRLDNSLHFKSLGLDELVQNPDNIILIEWAEKAKKLLPKNTTWINLEALANDKRKIIINKEQVPS